MRIYLKFLKDLSFATFGVLDPGTFSKAEGVFFGSKLKVSQCLPSSFQLREYSECIQRAIRLCCTIRAKYTLPCLMGKVRVRL